MYLQWVQQAITTYWRAVARKEDVDRLRWIVASHEIFYRKPAYHRDSLIATVQIMKHTASRAWFSTHIGRDGETVAEAHSTLCCLDASSGQLVRITPVWRSRSACNRSEPLRGGYPSQAGLIACCVAAHEQTA